MSETDLRRETPAPRPMDQIRDLVRGWAVEARQHADLIAELRVWMDQRNAIVTDLGMADEEMAAQILVLECKLADRLVPLLRTREVQS